MIKVLLLGLGRWGLNHLRIARSLPIELFVADPDPARLVFGRDAGVADDHRSSDPRAFIDQVQAVVLATPAQTHFELAREFALAGKDVFVEKPLALQSRHARTLAELAESKGRIIQVGHIFRFDPASIWLRDAIRDERFGSLRFLRGNFSGFKRPRSDSGVLFADAIHFVDLFIFLMGRSPATVRAHCRDLLAGGAEDQVLVTMDWSASEAGADVFASVEAGYHAPGKAREVVVVGEELTAVCDFNVAQYKIRTMHNRHINVGGERRAIEGEASQLEFAPEETLLTEWRAFLDSVVSRKSCLCDARAGYQTVRVLEAAAESAKSDCSVTLGAEDI